ncbi:branched-chain amino acid ABC transporter substrate-binding protein [Inquilinus limosus]|uniref:Branched chain amino acid ABC transporter substrate-binding protein n=1 Tax=Inquilinus limosus TaxID=171674 RepID=A0A211ZJ52_9PROT|nr:branched-chain amino acid ABC transporter substrate-binding protein [Inquilinus limosus]OWJ65318.1 branched chain amino acid ABC transporter substrate-binding protein [Inquilinus limosus]
MTRFNRVLLAGVALAAMTSAPAWADVKIGLGAPLTGPNASFGEQMKRGTDAAVKALNDAGGVNGEKITVVYGDDASDPRQGVAAANELVGEGVVAVIGHFNSSVSIPASAVYAEEGIVQISPASTNPQLTEQGQKTTFRTCGRDDQQGEVAGPFLAEKYKGKNVAILQDQTTYGKGLADATKAAMNKAGLKEVLYEGITVGEKDFSAVVSKMKQAKVDVIYYGGLLSEAGLILRQAREQGLTAQFISGDGIVAEEFWGITGDAGQGVLMTFGADQRNSPAAKDVVAKFKADNYDPTGYTLYSYAAVQAWAQAATKAKSFEGPKVAEALHDGSLYKTVLGELSFDEKGDRKQADYVFWIWNSGKFVEATQAELAKVGK